jgi:hypothetical protein
MSQITNNRLAAADIVVEEYREFVQDIPGK